MEKNKIYICSMHPEIQKDKPGICSKCGMNLVPQKAKKHEGHRDKHEGHKAEEFTKKFWVSLILTIPVLLYSDLTQKLFGFRLPLPFNTDYLLLVLSSIVFFYGGFVFLKSAFFEIRAKKPGMMTLISLAIISAYIYSVFTIIFQTGDNLFWELTTLIVIMLLGHFLEMKAVSSAQSALAEISKLIPDTALVIKGNRTETVPVSELKVGDEVLVKPGGRIPTDGLIISGESEVDESLITGESKPVLKEPKKQVLAGTINGDGSLKIKVNKIGEETFLAGVMRLIEEAQASKSKLQLLSDRAAFYLTLIAIFAGLLTLTLWLLAKAGPGFAIERLVAILVIACPHALGLAIPLVASISTTLAVKSGFLVKNRLALEAARNINMVLFDKTGTLTKGEYGVQNIFKVKTKDENELLQLAASVDAHSEHFISKALLQIAKEKKIKIQDVKNFQRIPGKGVSGNVFSRVISIGGINFIKGLDINLPKEIEQQIQKANQKGQTVVYVLEGREVLGIITLADLIRQESKEAIFKLKDSDVKIAMITGDSQDVARWVAKELEIDEYFAEVLPGQKAEKVKILQERGYKVAMVGDGINDAPALTQADVGIAIGAGTNVAIESAGIILVKNDPRDIPKIIALSKATYFKMLQNLFWATGYNVFALPLAAGALAFKGILLQPALSALLMSLSTIIVAINALTLKWRKI